MSNRLVLLLILLISTFFISGCIFDKNGNGNQINESKFIPQTNLPAGYTYMGTHDITVDLGGSSAKAIEGVYRYNGDDLYIQAIKNDTPEALIAQYKLRYKDANYNPFEEVSVNGHKATKVTDYMTFNGQQKPKYTVIWATGNYMLIVGTSTDAPSVLTLATATGG